MTVELLPIARNREDDLAEVLGKATELGLCHVWREKCFGKSAGDSNPEVTAAMENGDAIAAVVTDQKWLRWIWVRPESRGRGVGTALLAAAEAAVAAAGHTWIRTLDQPGNYLAPGLDASDSATLGWFRRRGYQSHSTNENLIVSVQGNPRVTPQHARDADQRCADAGYSLRRAKTADASQLLDTIAAEFAPAWAYEVSRALTYEPCGVHIAQTREGALAAFAAHDGNNQGLGWFGPAGTFAEHRRRGLGEALLLRCLVDVADAGHESCTIAWIGPRKFYDRVAGIKDTRTFVVMRKNLEELQ